MQNDIGYKFPCFLKIFIRFRPFSLDDCCKIAYNDIAIAINYHFGACICQTDLNSTLKIYIPLLQVFDAKTFTLALQRFVKVMR